MSKRHSNDMGEEEAANKWASSESSTSNTAAATASVPPRSNPTSGRRHVKAKRPKSMGASFSGYGMSNPFANVNLVTGVAAAAANNGNTTNEKFIHRNSSTGTMFGTTSTTPAAESAKATANFFDPCPKTDPTKPAAIFNRNDSGNRAPSLHASASASTNPNPFLFPPSIDVVAAQNAASAVRASNKEFQSYAHHMERDFQKHLKNVGFGDNTVDMDILPLLDQYLTGVHVLEEQYYERDAIAKGATTRLLVTNTKKDGEEKKEEADGCCMGENKTGETNKHTPAAAAPGSNCGWKDLVVIEKVQAYKVENGTHQTKKGVGTLKIQEMTTDFGKTVRRITIRDATTGMVRLNAGICRDMPISSQQPTAHSSQPNRLIESATFLSKEQGSDKMEKYLIRRSRPSDDTTNPYLKQILKDATIF